MEEGRAAQGPWGGWAAQCRGRRAGRAYSSPKVSSTSATASMSSLRFSSACATRSAGISPSVIFSPVAKRLSHLCQNLSYLCLGLRMASSCGGAAQWSASSAAAARAQQRAREAAEHKGHTRNVRVCAPRARARKCLWVRACEGRAVIAGKCVRSPRDEIDAADVRRFQPNRDLHRKMNAARLMRERAEIIAFAV